MSPEKTSSGGGWKIKTSGSDERILQRLQEELGLAPEDAELVLVLRRQLLDLKTRVQELETELDRHRYFRNTHLTQYRQVYYEATWWDEEGE